MLGWGCELSDASEMNPNTAATLTSDFTSCGCVSSAGRQLREVTNLRE